MKRFVGLVKEDIKSKLWLAVASWYLFGMFCLLFAIKVTLPAVEVRSLYVGAGNTSFFAATVLLGIAMGAGAFRYLYSEKKSDLYFSLPFSKGQLFLSGYLSNFLIFSVPAVVCKILFFRISLSMGYCRYEDSARCVWVSCLFMVLGFLVVMNLSMLAFCLSQNIGYMAGLLILFFLGPEWGIRLAENMLGMFDPSFFRSEALENLKGYIPPLSLLAQGAGIREYADGPYWEIGSHLPYIGYMAVLALGLSLLSFLVFIKRPVERRRSVFTFRWVEWLVRYGCMALAVLWLMDAFRIFVVEGLSVMPAVVGAVLFIPLVHGLLNTVIAFDARKFVSAGKHLLAEIIVMSLMIGMFMLIGKQGARLPEKEQVVSMALALTAQRSGDDPENVLLNMKLTDKELSAAYQLIGLCEEETGLMGESYDILVKYELKDGGKRYRKCRLPIDRAEAFKDIFAGKEFKEGTYGVLRLDGLKYYEIRWSNGLESYTLDLDEQERAKLWEAYRDDLENLTFSDICLTDPVGAFTFASTKNRGDETGYIYPGFKKVHSLLKEYGIDAAKRVSDYEITKIVVDQYLFQEGMLYDVCFLESESTVTDQDRIREMVQRLVPEEFCVDDLLLPKDFNKEYTVYYRDSKGKTVNSIKCVEFW